MKKLIPLLVALASFSSGSAHGEGTQIGTGPLLLAMGVANIFTQIQVGDSAAIVVHYNDVDGTYLDTTVDRSTVCTEVDNVETVDTGSMSTNLELLIPMAQCDQIALSSEPQTKKNKHY